VSAPQFFETRMGRQHYEVTLPSLVRELHRLNDLLALAVEQMEQNTKAKDSGGKSDATPRRG